MFFLTDTDLFVLGPTLTLAVGILVVFALRLVLPASAGKSRLLLSAGIVTLAIAAVLTAYQYSPATDKESDVLELLGPALRDVWYFRMATVVGSLIVVVSGLLGLLLVAAEADPDDDAAPTVGLVLIAVCGATWMVVARSVLFAFVGFELVTLSLAALSGAKRPGAAWAALVPGLLAGAVLGYGLALLYAGEGGLAVLGIGPVSRPGLVAPAGLSAFGATFVFAGLFMNLAVFPFHARLRRAGQDDTAGVAALRSLLTATAGFLLLMALAPLVPRALLPLLPLLCAATIAAGCAGACIAGDLRSLLASDAVAQIGLIMIVFTALCVGQGAQDAGYAIRSALLYLAAYALGAAAAWGAVIVIERSGENLAGLGRRRPWLGAGLSVALLSLAGAPPTLGFWARLEVCAVALQTGMPGLTIVALLLVAVMLGNVLRVLARVWTPAVTGPVPTAAHSAFAATTVGLGALTVTIVGILPWLFLDTLIHIKL